MAFDSTKKKNRYRTHLIAIRALSPVFRVKFNVEFTRQAVNFSIEHGLSMVHAAINRALVDRFECFHKYLYIVRHWHN